MAHFSIISSQGGQTIFNGTPRYVGAYLKPGYLEFGQIGAPSPISWHVGDYVVYSRTGKTYRLYRTPQTVEQGSSNRYGASFLYENVQFYDDSKQLEFCPFTDLVPGDNTVHFSTQNTVSFFGKPLNVAERVQACLEAQYGSGSWEIRIVTTTDADLLEILSTEVEFSVTGVNCLEVLDKVYETWNGLGWIHTVENGKNVITIGASNVRTNANTTVPFSYSDGLVRVERSIANADQIGTRLFAYGSMKNMDATYYRGLDIYNAESVDIEHLMIPLANWGTTGGKPDARKAYIDNAAAIAALGLIPRTAYFDGTGDLPDIHPTIEGMTIGEVYDAGGAGYLPNLTKWSRSQRVDEIVVATNPTDHGTSADQGQKYIETQTGNIAAVTRGFYTDEDVSIGIFYRSMTRAGRVTLRFGQNPQTLSITGSWTPDFNLSIEVAAGSAKTVIPISPTMVSSTQWGFALPESVVVGTVPEGSTVSVTVVGFVSGGTQQTDVVSLITDSSTSVEIGIEHDIDKTFSLRIPQIGFDIEKYAALGNGKTVSMKTGMCGARDFEIKDVQYVAAYDAWDLTLYRSIDEDLNIMFPNVDYPIAAGDLYVLLDIAMPELYVSVASNRLLSAAQRLLADISTEKPFYSPQIDAKVVYNESRILREGMWMDITQDGDREYVLIDSITIDENGSNIPTYEVALREKKGIEWTENVGRSSSSRSSVSVSGGDSSQSNGTVTSVGLVAPTGLEVEGSPVTGAGILKLKLASGYKIPLESELSGYFEINQSRQTEVDLKQAYEYFGPKKGLIFDSVLENDTSDADLYVKWVGEGTSRQRVLYSPLALITGGDQIVEDGTPGGGDVPVHYLNDLTDVVITSPSNGQALVYQNGEWVNGAVQSGSVTSVGLSMPTGFSVSGSPVTSSGTLAVSFANGYSLPTTAKQTNWDTAYGWGNHANAGYLLASTASSTYQPIISDLETIRSGASAGATAVQPGSVKTLAIKVGTITIGSGYDPLGSGNTTLTISAQNLYDTIGSTKYHPYGGDTGNNTFKIGGATFTWHPESSAGAGDEYLELNSAFVTSGDQIVGGGTPGGGGGGGASYLSDLLDVKYGLNPSADDLLIYSSSVPLNPDGTVTGPGWTTIAKSSVGRIYTGGAGITIGNDNTISVTANTYAPYNSAGYLPLSAGPSYPLINYLLIQNGSDAKIVFDNTDNETNYQYISFRQNGTEYGTLGVRSTGSTDLMWGANTVLHAGNYASYNNYTSGLKVSGRLYGSGDDEGIVVSPAANGFAGLTLGSYNGRRSVFYLNSTDAPFWRYNDGTTSYSISHPGKNGTIALTSDISTAVADYLPLSAGSSKPLTGDLYLTAGKGIEATGGAGLLVYRPATDTWTGVSNTQWAVGATDSQGVIRSNNNNLLHYRNGTTYDIWDKYNAGTSTTAWTCSTLTTNGSVTIYESSSHTYRWTLNFNGAVGRLYAINDAATAYNDILINNTITVTSGYNVGISNTSPGYKLDVNGDIALKNAGILRGYDTNGTARSMIGLDTDNAMYVGWGVAGAGYDSQYCGNNILFKTSTSHTTRMYINSSGNVTIGSSDLASTDYKFYVNGSAFATSVVVRTVSDYGVLIGGPGSNVIDGLAPSDAYGNLHLNYSSTGHVTLCRGGGNVGIGTTSPSYKLHVNGKFYATGQIQTGYFSTNRNAAQFIFDKAGTNLTGIGANNETNTIYLGACDTNGTWVDYAQIWKFGGSVVTTGNVSANTLTISSTEAGSHIAFSRGNLNYFTAPASGYFGFSSNGKGASLANCDLVINNAEVSVNGYVTIKNNYAFRGYDTGGNARTLLSIDSGNGVYVAYGAAGAGYNTYISGNNIYLYYGTSHTTGMSMSSAGAVRFNIPSFTDFQILRTNSSGSAAVTYYPANQTTNYWAAGADPNSSTTSIAYRFFWYYNGAYKAYLTTGGTLVTIGDQTVSSDLNLKTNLQPVTYSVEDIAKTRAVTFDWKDGRGHSAGSIAQDWKPLIPELVHGEEGNMTLAYGQIALVNTILLARKSEGHEERIKELEARVAELEMENERLRMN